MLRLKLLSKWLKENGFKKHAQAIDEWDEPWHEEAVKEFGEQPTDEGRRQKSLEEKIEYVPTEEETLGYRLDEEPVGTDIGSSSGLKSREIRDVYYNIMKDVNFTPVSAGGKTPYIGGGAFGKVFRGVYGGKPAIIKVLIKEWFYLDHAQDKEIDNWNKILEHSKNLKPEFQRHIPEVYDTLSGTLNISNDDYIKKVSYDAVVMEELYELPRAIYDMLSGGLVDGLANFILEPEILNKLSMHLTKEFSRGMRYYGIKNEVDRDRVLRMAPGIFFKEILKNKNNLYHPKIKQRYAFYSSMAEEIINQIIDKVLSPESKENFLARNESKKKMAIKDLKSQIMRAPTQIMGFFPGQWDAALNTAFKERSDKSWEKLPEFRSLIEMLKTLTREIELGWWDLHRNNMMMDKDGNLKIIDVGLYKDLSDEVF